MLRPAPAARPPRRATLALATSVALSSAACSQHALVARDDVTDVADAAVGYDTAPYDGLGYVDGRVVGHAVFNKIGAIYWFGGDNDPSRLQVWIYEVMPTCAELSTSGWIPRVRPTDLMGLTIGGNKPGVYVVKNQTPPAPGYAYLLHVVDQADPTIDSEGESGTVTITAVKPGESVSGAFLATFSSGTLQGSFNAVWCPTGVAP
jgi:hypothetical protein